MEVEGRRNVDKMKAIGEKEDRILVVLEAERKEEGGSELRFVPAITAGGSVKFLQVL